MAFGIGPTLTMGAVEALDRHGSEALKAKYLAKLVSGEWMGTMNLTEPQAGSDLGALRTRAEPAGDGTYRIFGQKIFITYGEHDLTDNIIHLVLARLPGCAGRHARHLAVSGAEIPRRATTARSARATIVFCAGARAQARHPCLADLHHDLWRRLPGAEPGAIGWLIGEENNGLACMFTMMNNARLAVGMQGVAVAEAATQKAIAYANERRQGRARGLRRRRHGPIIHHPDVAAHAPDDEGADAGGARHLLCLRRTPSTCAHRGR